MVNLFRNENRIDHESAATDRFDSGLIYKLKKKAWTCTESVAKNSVASLLLGGNGGRRVHREEDVVRGCEPLSERLLAAARGCSR